MTKEEAYKFLEKASSNTQSGLLYVHIVRVEEAIKAVSDDEELRERALDGIYKCERNSGDWMQLDDAKYFIDIALGIKDDRWLSNKSCVDDVEYTRTDVFIEKAWGWIEDNLLTSNQQDRAKEYFEQFKKAM